MVRWTGEYCSIVNRDEIKLEITLVCLLAKESGMYNTLITNGSRQEVRYEDLGEAIQKWST